VHTRDGAHDGGFAVSHVPDGSDVDGGLATDHFGGERGELGDIQGRQILPGLCENIYIYTVFDDDLWCEACIYIAWKVGKRDRDNDGGRGERRGGREGRRQVPCCVCFSCLFSTFPPSFVY